MLYVGDYVTLKKGLVLGRKYGSVTFSRFHSEYVGKLLIISRISKVGTAYCLCDNHPCECGTIHENMVDVARFKVGDTVVIGNSRIITNEFSNGMLSYCGDVARIEKVLAGGDGFIYHLTIDDGFYNWPEKVLTKIGEADEAYKLKDILENDSENRLQKPTTSISVGKGVEGGRVHGGYSKASIRSRPLRDAQSVRGK